MKSFLTSFSLSLALLSPMTAMENNRLTREERDRVGHLYARVMRDNEVREARKAHEEALNRYHEALRNAMTKRDPKIKPALDKIQMNPALLAEAIWEKRSDDVMDNLHLPVRRLEKEERQRWNAGMQKLRSTELSAAFGKRIEENYKKQVRLRKEHTNIVREFKNAARRKLMAIDQGLKPIMEKLEQPSGDPVTAKAAQTQVEEVLPPEAGDVVAPETKEADAESERIPAMPMPMPGTGEEEC